MPRAPLSTLSGEGLLLRPIEPGDLGALWSAIEESRPELERWMTWCHPQFGEKDAATWIASCGEQWATGIERPFSIFDAASGEFLGNAGINQLNVPNRYANLGYWIRTPHAGRGITTRAVRLLAAYGFAEMGLTRIEIVVQPGNDASRRVAEKVGARLEGLCRNRVVFRGVPADASLYSLVPGDLD